VMGNLRFRIGNTEEIKGRRAIVGESRSESRDRKHLVGFALLPSARFSQSTLPALHSSLNPCDEWNPNSLQFQFLLSALSSSGAFALEFQFGNWSTGMSLTVITAIALILAGSSQITVGEVVARKTSGRTTAERTRELIRRESIRGRETEEPAGGRTSVQESGFLFEFAAYYGTVYAES
jgi:hypothetical protein